MFTNASENDALPSPNLRTVTSEFELRVHQAYPKHKLNTVQLIRLALKIRPVKLNKSIYVRIPNDIADLIGIDGETDVTLRLQDSGEEYFLIYAIRKARAGSSNQPPVVYADQKVTTTTRGK